MSTPVTVYVPRDSAARSVGADEVADRIVLAASQRGRDVTVVRNGSRGLLWLEPMVEVATSAGRVAYGPVQAADVDGLLDSGFLEGKAHALHHGIADEIPWLKRQTRLTFARCGVVDPASLDDYRAHDGLKGLAKAVSIGAEATIEEVRGCIGRRE